MKSMDESNETSQELRSSVVDDSKTDVQDDPCPYESDTEEVDLDSFVKSIPHDTNDWRIYYSGNFALEKIGDGFFGEIYKATDSKSGDVYVMKTIKKTTKMKLMCAEIRLMARLKHPNILRFLGVCVDSSRIHLLTEYMEIGNLEEVVADDKELLPWSLRMKLSHDIAKGMAYLHSVGVIHRDLASKNVLISNKDNEYTAVVADFGLAAKIPSRKKKLNVVGSPYWMAPEVLRHDQYNETVDIFSYGIILCEIIGRVHSSPDEIPRTNLFGLDVDKFSEIVQGCPPEFLQLAVCCCQVDPQARPPFELTAKFLEYIRQLEIVVGSPTMLIQDTRTGNQRMSANIEDWLIDSRKSLETPVKYFPPCNEDCVCENGTTPVANGSTDGVKPPEEEKSTLNVTPCRGGQSNKRHSFFAGLRYKHFRPHVDTEDLVKNTPSKLAGFFNRVLHAQKKRKFDSSSRKKRSKTTHGVSDDVPKLRSFRMFNKDRSTSDAQVSPSHLSKHNGDNCLDGPGRKLGEKDNALSLDSYTTPQRRASSSRASSCKSSYSERTPTAVSPTGEFTGSTTSCESENPYLMTWSESVFCEGLKPSQSTDINGYYDIASPIPRCFSESDVGALKVASIDKTRTFSSHQSPQKTKHKRNWNIFNFFHRRSKEKQKT